MCVYVYITVKYGLGRFSTAGTIISHVARCANTEV